ncbi:hypothetical protein FMK56_08750 [Klebsiella oxytoca]|nr:hypothetical protein [Klebsiella oxytoca]
MSPETDVKIARHSVPGYFLRIRWELWTKAVAALTFLRLDVIKTSSYLKNGYVLYLLPKGQL